MKPVAKVILFDADERILVLRRSGTHPVLAYHLDFPGGDVEDGEEPHTAAVREVYEEAGLELQPAVLELVHQGLSSKLQPHLVYTARLSEKQPAITISWEHDQATWMSHGELLAWELPPRVDGYFLTALEYLKTLS